MPNADDEDVSKREFNSLRKQATKNFAGFAIAVQHVSAEVQAKILEQLPEFRKLAADAVESTQKSFEATLASNQASEEHVHEAFRQWREALLKMLNDPDLSLDDKLRITAEIGRTAEAQARKDTESKAFKADLFKGVAVGTLAVAGLIVVAMTGGKFGIGPGGSNDA